MLPKKLIVIIFTTFYHYLLLLLLFLGVRQATAASFTWTWLVCAPKSSSVSQQGQIKWHRPGSLPTTHTLSRSLSLSLSFCLSVCLALWLPHLVTPVALLSPTLSDSCPPFMQALHPSLLICRRSQWHRCFFGGCFVRPRSGQRGT